MYSNFNHQHQYAELAYLNQMGQFKTHQRQVVKEILWSSNPSSTLLLPYLNSYFKLLLLEGKMEDYLYNLLKALSIHDTNVLKLIFPFIHFYLSEKRDGYDLLISAILKNNSYKQSQNLPLTHLIIPYLESYLDVNVEFVLSDRLELIANAQDSMLIDKMRALIPKNPKLMSLVKHMQLPFYSTTVLAKNDEISALPSMNSSGVHPPKSLRFSPYPSQFKKVILGGNNSNSESKTIEASVSMN